MCILKKLLCKMLENQQMLQIIIPICLKLLKVEINTLIFEGNCFKIWKSAWSIRNVWSFPEFTIGQVAIHSFWKTLKPTK